LGSIRFIVASFEVSIFREAESEEDLQLRTVSKPSDYLFVQENVPWILWQLLACVGEEDVLVGDAQGS